MINNIEVAEKSISTAIVFQAIADGYNISLYDDDNNGECILFESIDQVEVLDKMWDYESVLVVLHRYPSDNIAFFLKFGDKGYNVIADSDGEYRTIEYLQKFIKIASYFHWLTDPEDYFNHEE